MLRLSVERVRQGHGYRNVLALFCGHLLFPRVLIRLKIEHNHICKGFILLAWKLATPWVWSLMLSCSHRTTNLYSAWTIVSFPCNILNIHLLLLHSSLSSCSKHNLCPGNIVNIRGNDNHGTSILFYSRDDTRPLDTRDQPLTSLPTQLIMDVDSMPLCLAL